MNTKPKILTIYIIKEFILCLLIFMAIFLSLLILINFVEEIIFFREKKIIENLYLKTIFLTFVKTPSIMIELMPFVILFSSILFFVKFIRKKEILPINLSGFSNNFIILVPAIFSFFFGIIIITVFTPITSELTKYYEKSKQFFYQNENLVVISNTGLWLKEKNLSVKRIIRADKIVDKNFSQLQNISIYFFSSDNFSEKRIDAKKALILKKEWNLESVNIFYEDRVEKIPKLKILSDINIDEIKNFFINSNTFSIWSIPTELKKLRERGYYGHELLVLLNKYLALPFMLFLMVLISTFFTINSKEIHNNFFYIFFGILAGIAIYFLNDLSIALGKTGKVPLIASVWIPVLVILITCVNTLFLRKND